GMGGRPGQAAGGESASMGPCRCRHGMTCIGEVTLLPDRGLQWGRVVADTECLNRATLDGPGRSRELQWGRVVADTECISFAGLPLNLPLIFIGCRKLQRTRADW